MTILTVFILIGAIVLVALAIAYNAQKGVKTLEQMRANFYDNEEAQEIAELATQLYNKDLRTTVGKKATKDIEVISEDITLQVIEAAATKPKKKRKYYPKAPNKKA